MNTEALRQFLSHPQSIPLAHSTGQTAVLPLGKVLTGEAVVTVQGQRGLTVGDQLIEVALPEGIDVGAQVKLILTQKDGQLLLQLLDTNLIDAVGAKTDLIQSASSGVRTPFDNILKAILPELSLSDIKKSYQNKTSLLQLLPGKQALNEQNLQTQTLKTAFEKLFGADLLFNAEKLQSPKALEQALKNIVQLQSGKTKPTILSEIKSSLLKSNQGAHAAQNSAQNTQTPLLTGQEREIVKQLTSEITKLVPSGSRELLPLHSQKASFNAHYYPALQNLLAHAHIRELPIPQQLPPPLSAVGELLAGILRLKFASHQTSDGLQNFFDQSFSKEFFTELSQLLNGNNQDIPVKSLRNILDAFESLLRKDAEASTYTKTAPNSKSTDTPFTHLLEQMIQTHESLGKLLPIMHQSGEPLFFLLPTLLGGIIENWEMRIDKPPLVEKEDGKKRDKKDDFTRIHLSVGLRSLGQAQIDLAHRKDEILLSLTFENEDITEYVDCALPKLEKALRSSGYTRCSLITRTGDPQSVRPNWFEMLQEEIVA